MKSCWYPAIMAAAIAFGSSAALAQPWPSKPIRAFIPFAASTPTRAPELPNVPTSLDAGYPNSDLIIWYGVFMPSKTAREIVEKFHAAATKVLATPAMQHKLKQLAINPMPITPADMDRLSLPN